MQKTITNLPTEPKRKCVAVKFFVECVTTPGQTVCLTGNLKELKRWDTNSAIRLVATNYTAAHPLWETEFFVTLPLNTQLEYKFFVIRQKPEICWEKLPNNAGHSLYLQEGGSLELHHKFGSPKVVIKKCVAKKSVQIAFHVLGRTRQGQLRRSCCTRHVSATI